MIRAFFPEWAAFLGLSTIRNIGAVGIEAVTDRVSLEDHTLAKRAKDLGSAAVMVSMINVPVVWFVTLHG
jgi:diacylglycerol kinase